jgi:presenilin 1
VLLAWQLSHFDSITGWALLIALGFYDLCAVLTPCGPLKALVGLMQSREEAGEGMQLPGLLYEARLPVGRLYGGRGAGEEDELEEPPASSSISSASSSPSPPSPSSSPLPPDRPVPLPFSLARSLRLQILDPSQIPPPFPKPENAEYTPEQNLAVVDCGRPPDALFARGAREEGDMGDVFHVRTPEGEDSTYVIDSETGKVFLRDDDDEEEEEGGGVIKLGLGDFIFYSVLVSKAAMYSLTTAVICIIVILSGLGMTLFLLSVYKMALPALPVSIFCGVTFYALGVYAIQPYIETVLSNGPLYL